MWSNVFQALILALNIVGTASNLTALCHVTKSFNIKVPIFSFIFTDALIATSCSIVTTIITIIRVVASIDSAKVVFCTVEFLSFLLPSYLGACLIFLVTSVRFYFTVSTTKNHKLIKNSTVLALAFCLFGAIATFILSYIIINVALDLPTSFMVEECSRPAKDIRPPSSFYLAVMQIPNFFNVCSLVIDLCLIRILRKKVLPFMAANDQPVEAVATISGQLYAGQHSIRTIFEINLITTEIIIVDF